MAASMWNVRVVYTMIKTGVFLRSSCLTFGRSCLVTSSRDLSQIKMTKVLSKMLNKDKKRKWHKNSVAGDSLTAGPSEGAKRRAQQVSKFLYDYISNIINTGELSSELADMAVDIVKVKMTPDFCGINVYWAGSGSDTDKKLEELLKQHEGKLREILISYHVLGTIPKVTFVRDRSAYKFKDVESLLKTADFGPDFEPTQAGTNIRSNPLRDLNQVENVSDKFRNLSLEFLCSSDSSNVIKLYPPRAADDARLDNGDSKVRIYDMFDRKQTKLDFAQTVNLNFRNDLYGLPHDEIMRKLMMKKQKTKHRTLVAENENPKDISKEAYQKHMKKFERRKKLGKTQERYMTQYFMSEPVEDNWHVEGMWSDEAYESDPDEDYDTVDDGSDSDYKERK